MFYKGMAWISIFGYTYIVFYESMFYTNFIQLFKNIYPNNTLLVKC